MSMLSLIQVGCNPAQGIVKLRAPDAKSPGGWIVQCLSPLAARSLATWLEDGVPDKRLKITDGHRWTEHEIPPEGCQKLANDLRDCADMIESELSQT